MQPARECSHDVVVLAGCSVEVADFVADFGRGLSACFSEEQLATLLLKIQLSAEQVMHTEGTPLI